ncbi:ADP-forming succinate--CoA ligase subunit beta [Blattabacterium cuenoti]|uniref:ADP-forming succinate--CoA ligase subunit beta n=1 Tax=Blattabacterium cuenoti TaxID=1653831 RepID=UPI00163D1322|nr:ADP-forming succinate--CoA ligase subunit beta [Blattabacterium cuenoti]
MNLYEYQGREILKKFLIKVPDGIIVYNSEEAVKAAKILFKRTKKKSLVIKAQIHAGGRGKSGGIRIVKNLTEVYHESKNLLGKYLITPQTSKKGILVKKILISEDIYSNNDSDKNSSPKEYFLSILLNRDKEKNIILYSKEGGINIEELSKKNPEKIFSEEIDPLLGLQMFQIRNIASNLEINKDSLKNFSKFITYLNKAYHSCDALLMEINPFIKTLDNEIIPADIKIILDNNSFFRQKNNYLIYNNFVEKKVDDYNFNFLKLDGNVGCMVNGAGLAMATMDMIKSCGGDPANFLDIGGSADEKRVEKALHLILKDKSVKTILINIFGGIVRCDTVAKGIIKLYNKINQKIKIPLVIRLQGTNEKNAKNILNKSSLPIYYANDLKDAANKIKQIVS